MNLGQAEGRQGVCAMSYPSREPQGAPSKTARLREGEPISNAEDPPLYQPANRNRWSLFQSAFNFDRHAHRNIGYNLYSILLSIRRGEVCPSRCS